MDDRIAMIVKDQLSLVERQLALAHIGVKLSAQEAAGLPFMAMTVEELIRRADALRAALSRYQMRPASPAERLPPALIAAM